MRIEYYKALWGMEGMPLEKRLQWVADNGYDGFETPLGGLQEARKAGYTGKAVAMLFVESVEALHTQLAQCREAKAEAVTVHCGKDWWDFERGAAFFDGALQEVDDADLPVHFETHRGRLLFEPQSTKRYLERFPELRICADFSHWTCVCESMLGDQEEALGVAIQRTGHLHARIGHEEGPQVPDPRSPRWKGQVDRFFAIFDRVKGAHQARGAEVMRVDPEFGPPNYMWTEPAEGKPMADLLDVCNWTRDRLRDRWN